MVLWVLTRPSVGVSMRLGAWSMGCGCGEEVSLHVWASELEEYGDLFVVVDAFGDDEEVEVLGECDDGGDDGGVLAFGADRPDEGLVDLDDVEGEGSEVGEGRVAGAEVIERDVDAEGSQRVQERRDVDCVVDEGAFGEFEGQQARGRELCVRARCCTMSRSLAVEELAAGDIDRDP